MMHSKIGIVRAIAFWAVFAALGTSARGAGEPIQAATTIAPLKYICQKIGGEYVIVNTLIPKGGDPHSYTFTTGQLKSLKGKNLYVALGTDIDFEMNWLEKIRALFGNLTVVNVSAGIPLVDHDPHTWLSVANTKIMAANILRAFQTLDPEHRTYYQKRYREFIKELDRLEGLMREAVSGYHTDTVIFYHSAWGYFARDHALEIIAISDHGREPTLKHVRAIIRKARQKNIRHIFVSRYGNARTAGIIADEIGAEIIRIDHLAEDYLVNFEAIAKTLTK